MSELEKFLEESKNEILDLVSKELGLPKDMLKPYCPVVDFTQRFKDLDKPVFEDECYIRIGIEARENKKDGI